MSVQAMSWVFQHSQARLGARLVLLAIANHADKDGRNSWASVRQLGEECHLSEREVRYALRDLERSSEVVRVGVSPNRTHVYEIPAMASLLFQPEGANLAPAEFAGGKIRRPRGQNPSVKGATIAPEPKSNRPEPSTFVTFWETYPRKVGKRKAKLAYTAALRRASADAILVGAEQYRDDPNRSDEYTAHPTTWLNRDGWEDEPIPDRLPRGIEPARKVTTQDEIDALAAEIRRRQQHG